MIGLAAGDRVPVPVTGHRHRVDRVDLAASGAQARDKQAARRLDRHRDRVFGAVAVLGEQCQQPGQAGRVIADPQPGQQPQSRSARAMSWWSSAQSIPQNTSNYLLLIPSVPLLVQIRAVQGTHAPYWKGSRAPPIRSAVCDPGCPQAPVPARARRLPALMRGLLLQMAQATTTHTGTNSSFRGSARRVGWPPEKHGRCRDPDLRREVAAPVMSAGPRQRTHQPGPASLGQGVTNARIAIDMDLASRPRHLD